MKKGLVFLLICSFATLNAQVPYTPNFDRLLSLGKFYKILHQIDSLYQKGERRPELYYYSGKANEGIMRYNEAYRYYLKWYESDTTQILAQLTLAKIASLAGHRNEAIERYENLAQQDSINFTVNYSLGRLYQQTGKLNKAIEVYRRQYNVDTANVTLLTRIGDCLVESKMGIEALPIYSRGFYYDVQNLILAMKIVNIVLADGNLMPIFEKSVETIIDTAVLVTPKSFPLRQSQGVFKYRIKKYEEAIEIFTRLQEEGDSSKIGYKYLGSALFQQGAYNRALPYLSKADTLYRAPAGERMDIELSMKYVEALCYVGNSKKALEILADLENVLQPSPALISRIFILDGMAYSVMGKQEKAIQFYWKAYKSDEDNQYALVRMAYIASALWSSAQANKIEANYRLIWYTQILYLQKVEEEAEVSVNEQHAYSRRILESALESLFFSGKKQLEVKNPDGKKIIYTENEIRQLIKRKE